MAAQRGRPERSPVKPEYVWRPSQILRRLAYRPCNLVAPLSLPWNCTISACSAEGVGHSIATQGLYDLPVTEAIIRLSDAGDTALDVGANIGYMTLVLAMSTGPNGHVLCFEPNPRVLSTLRANVKNWNSPQLGQIHIETVALSDQNGEGILGFPDDYDQNQGTASLETGQDGIPVSLRRLDSLPLDRVGLMKVDVEGHEHAVFAGAEKLLAPRLARDILFEEHETYPARSHRILLQHGYTIFRLGRSTWRPLLLPPEQPVREKYLPANYLATADPARARARFAAWGWWALSNRLRRGKGGSRFTGQYALAPANKPYGV